MRVRRWELAELDLSGTAAASVIFSLGARRAVADMFHHGDRTLARFAPDHEGAWTYVVIDAAGASIDQGVLDCDPAAAGDHGPVEVDSTRFRHADGTAHVPLPTTALWWHRQPEPVRQQTLDALRSSPITAVRQSVLPPDETGWPDDSELDRVEWAITALHEVGLQAELVIFGDGRALDRPGWSDHLRAVVARFAAFRNVSWCLATDADRSGIEPARWDEALRLLAEHDHGHRLCTVHADPGFDFGDRRISHCSVRTDHARSSSTLNDNFAKPVIMDGAVLEGDAPVLSFPEPTATSFPEPVEGQVRSRPVAVAGSSPCPSTGSGNEQAGCPTGSGRGVGPRPEPVGDPVGSLTAEEVVLHAWETAVRGGFAAHGEWFLPRHPDLGPWWANGGELRGESLPRLAFLRQVLADVPGDPRYLRLRPDASTLGIPGEYYLQYLGAHRFRSRSFELPDGAYRVEVINTWDLTIEEVLRSDSGRFTVSLPPRLYHAIRVTRC
ncbi:DUF5605 domain-containing protein [Microlunatus speluncae]|uniref:DUF5605 domain-containing protein n=1 Tax=Microlunatus speluncae TaxID=2594267 RepID=UPI0012667E60|nr:DUF5605 domain-containing protein [Microlunatus speluncae]